MIREPARGVRGEVRAVAWRRGGFRLCGDGAGGAGNEIGETDGGTDGRDGVAGERV